VCESRHWTDHAYDDYDDDRPDDPLQCTIADALAVLRPTAADLAGCANWRCRPTPMLLATVRRGSSPASWLSLQPTLAANARATAPS
jgi:hypothetical protein